MNAEFKEKFNLSIPLIPLKETGQIQAGNATRVDWNMVCPNDGEAEIYLIGNPPYVGSGMQSTDQKADFSFVFGKCPFSRNLDYIALWFIKGADYIEATRAELAFVTTNSVAQGQHVELMFPIIFAKGLEIGFAYTSFKWENNAKRNAGVTVAVIGLRTKRSGTKHIYTDDLQIHAKNINGYLADAPNVCVGRRSKPLSQGLPAMLKGSQPTDGGHLVLEPSERRTLLESHLEVESFMKRYMGSSEFINDIERYCLWIDGTEAQTAEQIPELSRRFRAVEKERLNSKKLATRALVSVPFRFAEPRYKPTDAIIVPSVSSERRRYIPMGYLGSDTVVSNLAFAVYDAEPWLFSLLMSSMHMAWTRAVGGRMKTDYRYSNTIVYNNFPIPTLSSATKEKLTEAALRVLDVREYHCERTLAELYDPDLMPKDLRLAHQAVDDLVDAIYSKRGYETDEQRLSDLFAMYETLTAAESA